MKKLKCLLTTLALLLCFSAPAIAGDTQGPSDPAPGEMSSPPGETQTPPGDGHSPGLMVTLLAYFLGLE